MSDIADQQEINRLNALVEALVKERDEALADVATLLDAIEERGPVIEAQISRGEDAHKRLAVWIDQANQWKGRAEAAEAEVAALKKALNALLIAVTYAAAPTLKFGEEAGLCYEARVPEGFVIDACRALGEGK